MAQIGSELHRYKDPEALVRGYVFVYGAGTASPELLQAAHKSARDNGVPFHLHAGFRAGGRANLSKHQWKEPHRASERTRRVG